MKTVTINYDLIYLDASEILSDEPRPIKIMFGEGIRIESCNFRNGEWLDKNGEPMTPRNLGAFITITDAPYGILLK